MADFALESSLTRIAAALEKQNDMYKQVNDLNNVRYEAQFHDDLIKQIVSLNERLAHMANTIGDQNRVIMEQESRLARYEKGLDREGRNTVDSPG